jgi:hypothetical protein
MSGRRTANLTNECRVLFAVTCLSESHDHSDLPPMVLARPSLPVTKYQQRPSRCGRVLPRPACGMATWGGLPRARASRPRRRTSRHISRQRRSGTASAKSRPRPRSRPAHRPADLRLFGTASPRAARLGKGRGGAHALVQSIRSVHGRRGAFETRFIPTFGLRSLAPTPAGVRIR